MIVDDESGVTYTVKHGLESLDPEYQVLCADTAIKFLDMLEQHQIPDLILLDIMLPGMNGWELFKKIKENRAWKHIPVIFLTNRKDATAKEAGSFLGDDYITKPFKIPDLKQHIERVLSS